MRLRRTEIAVLLLRPSKDVSLTFGFEREIAFIWSSYETVQPRTMQAIDQICAEDPLIGRIDQSVVFLGSDASNLREFVRGYCSENPETRMVVPFERTTLEAAVGNAWVAKNNIKENLFIRNLFDYKLPLKNDAYFYGREDVVAVLFDNIRKSHNTGIFGLRKTGKTSVLLKVQRLLRKTNEAVPVFFDCKRRSIRTGRADDIALKIIEAASSLSGRKYNSRLKSDEDIFDVLTSAVLELPKDKKLCVIFDEIEYISPISPLDDWRRDFIDLWQSLWTIQSQSDKICFIVCGVNATVCDEDRFESPTQPGRTVQNPMFSIFNVQFLKGLSLENLQGMINFFGRRMGLQFTDDAIEYLHSHYGGHPLLCRLACSYYHEVFLAAHVSRPIALDRDTLVGTEIERDTELASYCGHVVSEIRELYPEEYQMLEMLARNEWADYFELSSENEFVQHIREYGLVSIENCEFPRFEIPVIRDFLRKDIRRTKAFERSIENPRDRLHWLNRRVSRIVDDIHLLDETLAERALTSLYGGRGPKKAHQLKSTPLAVDEDSALSFLLKVCKILVEPADKHLTKTLLNNAEIAESAPNTTDALNEIRTFRNYFSHDDIRGPLRDEFEARIAENFLGSMPSETEDGWYRMQKHLLDALHVCIQLDLSKY